MLATTAGNTTADAAGPMVIRMTTDTAITEIATAIMPGTPTNAVALPTKGGVKPRALLRRPRRHSSA
ncbi:hypothetical protein BURK_004887 [Burkholderia sp. SJ98]|nr:hypothetical protein BURK_004887 [Burkholderia sp. SJ98]